MMKKLMCGNLLLMLLLAGVAQAGSVEYQVDVNTVSLEGIEGYLDFQFNPGDDTSDPATATIFDFTTDGTVGTDLPDIGDVSGDLPGTVTINNTDADNEYTPGFTFGSYFDVTFAINTPTISGNADTGSSLAISLFDSNFNSLLTDPANDPTVQINLDTNGNPTAINNSPNGEAGLNAVPEPASWVLLFGGFLFLGWLGRRSKRAIS
jgi:hypothetical protein